MLWGIRAINPAPAWSTWKPSGGGLGAVQQIAKHVGANYRLPDGSQLLDPIPRSGPVLSGNKGQPVSIPFIALRGPKGKLDQVFEVSKDNSLMYSMCGLGRLCAILTGNATAERIDLVRRETLELALYTFKYVAGIKYIVAFLPPKPGTNPAFAVYLQKDELAQQLKMPLDRTLTPRVASQITPNEQERVVALTGQRTYRFGVAQTPLGDPVLVLAPLPKP